VVESSTGAWLSSINKETKGELAMGGAELITESRGGKASRKDPQGRELLSLHGSQRTKGGGPETKVDQRNAVKTSGGNSVS